MPVEIACEKAFEEGDRLNVFLIGDGLPLRLSSYLQLLPSVSIYRSLEREPNCLLASRVGSVANSADWHEEDGRASYCAFRSFDKATDARPVAEDLRPVSRLPANMIVHVCGPAFDTSRHQADAMALAEQLLERHAEEHHDGTRLLFFSGVKDVSAIRSHPRLMKSASFIGVANSELLAHLEGGAAQYSGPDSAGSISRFLVRSESNRPVVICDLDGPASRLGEVERRIIAASAAALEHFEGQAHCDVLMGGQEVPTATAELDQFCADCEDRWSLSIRRRDLLSDMLQGRTAIECSLLVTACPHVALLGLLLECPTLLIATPETLPGVPGELVRADRKRLQISLSADLDALQTLLRSEAQPTGGNPLHRMLAAQTDKALAIASAYFRARSELDRAAMSKCCSVFGAVSRDLAELRARLAIEHRMRERLPLSGKAKVKARGLRRYAKKSYWQERKRKITKSIIKRLQSS